VKKEEASAALRNGVKGKKGFEKRRGIGVEKRKRLSDKTSEVLNH